MRGTVRLRCPYPVMEASRKTVVVAEDEILIRILAADVLTDAGFDVIGVGNAEDALATLQSRPWAIHLLFTDIHMPGQMTGLELAHHVRGIWPHVALLIASGRDKPLAAALPDGSIFLAKPYNPDHIVLHAKILTDA
jgi:two-component system, response regulator PdtaR